MINDGFTQNTSDISSLNTALTIQNTSGTATTESNGLVTINVGHPIIGINALTTDGYTLRATQVRVRTNTEAKFLIEDWNTTSPSPLVSTTFQYTAYYLNI